MGFLISKVIDFFSRSKNNFKIIILGIQNAGKTTILYRLSIGQKVQTTPTIGSNVEEISYNNVKFQAWDLGGQESMRSVWDVYFLNTDGVIYVIDSNDSDNYEESKTQFYKLINNENLKNAIILILANKQDMLSAKKVEELIQIYDLDKVKEHIWHIQPCSAETGEGLLNGIKWLSDQLVYKSSNVFPNNPYMPQSELDTSNRHLSSIETTSPNVNSNNHSRIISNDQSSSLPQLKSIISPSPSPSIIPLNPNNNNNNNQDKDKVSNLKPLTKEDTSNSNNSNK